MAAQHVPHFAVIVFRVLYCGPSTCVGRAIGDMCLVSCAELAFGAILEQLDGALLAQSSLRRYPSTAQQLPQQQPDTERP